MWSFLTMKKIKIFMRETNIHTLFIKPVYDWKDDSPVHSISLQFSTQWLQVYSQMCLLPKLDKGCLSLCQDCNMPTIIFKLLALFCCMFQLSSSFLATLPWSLSLFVRFLRIVYQLLQWLPSTPQTQTQTLTNTDSQTDILLLPPPHTPMEWTEFTD